MNFANILIFDSQFCSILFGGQSKNWYRKTRVFKYEYLIFPINIANFHWFSIVFNVKLKSFICFESIKQDRMEFVSSLVLYLNNKYKEENKSQDQFIDKINIEYKFTLQEDDYSCGIFMLQ